MARVGVSWLGPRMVTTLSDAVTRLIESARGTRNSLACSPCVSLRRVAPESRSLTQSRSDASTRLQSVPSLDPHACQASSASASTEVVPSRTYTPRCVSCPQPASMCTRCSCSNMRRCKFTVNTLLDTLSDVVAVDALSSRSLCWNSLWTSRCPTSLAIVSTSSSPWTAPTLMRRVKVSVAFLRNAPVRFEVSLVRANH